MAFIIKKQLTRRLENPGFVKNPDFFDRIDEK
jgi:hypothetical protein